MHESENGKLTKGRRYSGVTIFVYDGLKSIVNPLLNAIAWSNSILNTKKMLTRREMALGAWTRRGEGQGWFVRLPLGGAGVISMGR